MAGAGAGAAVKGTGRCTTTTGRPGDPVKQRPQLQAYPRPPNWPAPRRPAVVVQSSGRRCVDKTTESAANSVEQNS